MTSVPSSWHCCFILYCFIPGQYSTILKSRLKTTCITWLIITNKYAAHLQYVYISKSVTNIFLSIYKKHANQASVECSQFLDWTELRQKPAGCISPECFCSHTAHTHSSTMNVNKTPAASQTAATKVIIKQPMYVTHCRHTSILFQKKTR